MVWHFGRWLVAGMALAALAACAGPGSEGTAGGKGGYKIGEPYQIGGIWYRPKEDYEYDKTGIASWYGPKFHGKPTANGETFDMNAVSAAHNTLPMPSVAEVTNLENGRSLVVRINDRGPFARGRIIDLSKRAAELLGFAEQGTARVRVRVLAEESLAMKLEAQGATQQASSLPASPAVAVSQEELPAANGTAAVTNGAAPPAEGSASGGQQQAGGAPTPLEPAPEPVPQDVSSSTEDSSIYVQAGAFREQHNALRLSDSLSDYGPTRIVSADVSGERYYRVQLGPYTDTAKGSEMVWTLRDAGIPGARVVAN